MEGAAVNKALLSTPGRVLFLVEPAGTAARPWSFEVLDFDADAATCLIDQGEGFESWLDQERFETPGTYVIEEIVGVYLSERADVTWETWESAPPRPATEEEIKNRRLQR